MGWSTGFSRSFPPKGGTPTRHLRCDSALEPSSLVSITDAHSHAKDGPFHPFDRGRDPWVRDACAFVCPGRVRRLHRLHESRPTFSRPNADGRPSPGEAVPRSVLLSDSAPGTNAAGAANPPDSHKRFPASVVRQFGRATFRFAFSIRLGRWRRNSSSGRRLSPPSVNPEGISAVVCGLGARGS